MSLTVYDVKQKLLAICDDISVLEVLDISIVEILDRFEDRIESKLQMLSDEFECADLLDSQDDSEERFVPVDSDKANLRRVFEDDGYTIIERTNDDDFEGMDW